MLFERRIKKRFYKYIQYGDDKETLYMIENGKIRPSKSLQDALSSMLNGNEEFIMIDDQKIVYETALDMARKSYEDGHKRVLIVKGGPGTGKSVLAINILVKLTNISSESLREKMIEKNILIRDASNFKFLDYHFVRLAIKDRKSNLKMMETLAEFVEYRG